MVLTRPGGTPGDGGEVFLQPAAASGPDPFTVSTAVEQATPPPDSPPPSAATGTATSGTTTATRSVSGAAPGVYGGTANTASCDVEKQIKVLSAQPSKNSVFAAALGIQPAAVPGYLRSLTPVQLRLDTRVTNHGYRDGKATSYQAVLQAGTAVLVDDRGVPRVRCACGNPLGPPVALKANPKRFGQTWNSYQPAEVVVIAPAVTSVKKFVIYDHKEKHWYERDRGDHQGKRDKPVPPPVIPTPTRIPSVPPTEPTKPPKPTSSVTPTKPKPSGTESPSKSTTPSTTTSPSESGKPTPTPKPTPTKSGTHSETPSVTPSETPSETPRRRRRRLPSRNPHPRRRKPGRPRPRNR